MVTRGSFSFDDALVSYTLSYHIAIYEELVTHRHDYSRPQDEKKRTSMVRVRVTFLKLLPACEEVAVPHRHGHCFGQGQWSETPVVWSIYCVLEMHKVAVFLAKFKDVMCRTYMMPQIIHSLVALCLVEICQTSTKKLIQQFPT